MNTAIHLPGHRNLRIDVLRTWLMCIYEMAILGLGVADIGLGHQSVKK